MHGDEINAARVPGVGVAGGGFVIPETACRPTSWWLGLDQERVRECWYSLSVVRVSQVSISHRFDRSVVLRHVGSSRPATCRQSAHGPVVNSSHRSDSYDCLRQSAQSQLVLAAGSSSFRPQIIADLYCRVSVSCI